jgi:hypothetical protein
MLAAEGAFMAQVLHGIVHGKSIKFDQDLGVPEGQEVEVFIRPVTAMPGSKSSGEEAKLPADSMQILGWSDERNARRCALIEKDVRGTIAPEEARELEDLQVQLRHYRRHVAPLPLAQTRQMLEELERKAQANP